MGNKKNEWMDEWTDGEFTDEKLDDIYNKYMGQPWKLRPNQQKYIQMILNEKKDKEITYRIETTLPKKIDIFDYASGY